MDIIITIKDKINNEVQVDIEVNSEKILGQEEIDTKIANACLNILDYLFPEVNKN